MGPSPGTATADYESPKSCSLPLGLSSPLVCVWTLHTLDGRESHTPSHSHPLSLTWFSSVPPLQLRDHPQETIFWPGKAEEDWSWIAAPFTLYTDAHSPPPCKASTAGRTCFLGVQPQPSTGLSHCPGQKECLSAHISDYSAP